MHDAAYRTVFLGSLRYSYVNSVPLGASGTIPATVLCDWELAVVITIATLVHVCLITTSAA